MAAPGAGTARLSEHRVEGRSLSDLRPDDQFRCTALAGFSDNRMLCLQWVAGTAAAPSHALLEGAPGRQQTSMPSGSGLLPGPTLRALRARWDHGHWGWVDPNGSLSGAGWSSAEHSWLPLVVSWGKKLVVSSWALL